MQTQDMYSQCKHVERAKLNYCIYACLNDIPIISYCVYKVYYNPNLIWYIPI